MATRALVLCLLATTAAGHLVVKPAAQPAMLQTLDSAQGTPVTRVVNLLKDLRGTLQKDMDEDENLFDKLTCWCNNNEYGKDTSISEAEAKIADLEATIESLTARSAELKTEIADTEKRVADDKDELATATALRKKQAEEFHAMELDSIQNLENMKAALTVLSKHHDASFTQLPAKEGSVVKTALKIVASFQQRTGETYYPAYNSQSGEIMGVLKQMDEEMKAELSNLQKQETTRAAGFEELRNAKSAQIASGEASAERKEDELANTDNNLAEAKEDLQQTNDALSEDQKFLKNMKKTCAEAEKNFNNRKNARQEEMKAVAETIEILTEDEARDAMNGTYNFLQLVELKKSDSVRRQKASAVLRKVGTPAFSVLATSVQLDAFARVTKAIDDMLTQLNAQQADEVKKTDWCKSEIQSNDMATMKAVDLKKDLEATIGELGSKIERLASEIEHAKALIKELQIDLQRASIIRLGENKDFQKTVEDQTLTIEVLNKALDRLSNYYDKANLMQTKKQTPPVAQMEYKPSKGAGGIVSMIEKLIYDARELRTDAKTGEGESQAAYEEVVASTNAAVATLQQEAATKTKEKAQTQKDKMLKEGDLADTDSNLEDLAKLDADLHGECDYVLKNFDVRQQARATEMEALQQAKQILSGANMGR